MNRESNGDGESTGSRVNGCRVSHNVTSCSSLLQAENVHVVPCPACRNMADFPRLVVWSMPDFTEISDVWP